MIKILQEDSVEALALFKAQYLQQTTAPLDGMWLIGFVPLAKHYGFYLESELIGYCCVNDDGYLLQFHLNDSHQLEAAELLTRIVTNGCDVMSDIQGAFTSTAEPQMLSYCADAFTKFSVNALMYQYPLENAIADSAKPLSLLDRDQLALAVTFAHEAIGAPTEWLTRYFENLIDRQELFGYFDNDTLAATGECRLFDDYQSEYADLGVIVSPDHRRSGIATRVIQQLTSYACAKHLKPICSTEQTNIGAQKAISNAGFFAPHRIIQFGQPATSAP